MSDISPRYPDGSALDVVHLTHNDFGPQVERLVDYLARFVFTGGGSGIPSSIIQAKGDLIAGMGTNLPGRLPVGTDGFYLMADSQSTVGLSWRHPLILFDFKGDLIVGTGDNTAVRLPAGQPGFYLMADPNTFTGLSWQHPLAIIQAKGDLIAGTAQNVAVRLPVGQSGFYLMADPSTTTGLSWQHPLTLFNAKGDLIAGTGFRTSSNVPVGLPGYYLMADPLTPTGLSWQHPLTLFDAKGDLLIATANDAVTRLPLGTDGFVLTVDRAANAMGVKWAVGGTGGTGGGIPAEIINAKGDIIAGLANDNPGILSLGTGGFYLMADPAAATGLSWQHPLALFQAKGDLLTGTSALTATRLPVGTSGFYLMADENAAQGMSWQHPLTLFQAKGDLLTGTSALTATRLPVGPDGYYLMADNAATQGLSWQHPLILFQAKGDILAATAINAVTRVPIGTAGQVLTVDLAQPTGVKWATSTQTGIPASIIDAKGDLISGSAPDTAIRTAVGTSGYYLMADNLAPGGISWQHPLILFDAKGDLLAGTADNAATKVPLGTQGQVLTVDTAISTGMRWTTPSTPTGGIPPSILVSKGDLITATGSAAPIRLPAGSTGFYLMADGGVPAGLSWQHPLALFQTKGDLLAAIGPQQAARVPVGTNGYYLMADSGAGAGLSWQHPLTLYNAKGDLLVGTGNDAATTFPVLPTTTAGGYGILACNPDIPVSGLEWLPYPLPTGWGGTGKESPPAKQLLVGNDTGPFLSAPAGPSGYYLMGDTAQPTGVSWQHPLTLYDAIGDIIVGRGDNSAIRMPRGGHGTFLMADDNYIGTTGYSWQPVVNIYAFGGKGHLLAGTGLYSYGSMPPGTNGHYLMADSGSGYGMSWQHPLTLYQAKGDLLVGTGFNTAARLARGPDYSFLIYNPGTETGMSPVNSPIPTWLGGTGINTPTPKCLLAGNDTSNLAIVPQGPTGYYLMGDPSQPSGCSWQHPLGLYDASGDLIVGTGDNSVARLGRGASGQILSSTATTLQWINPPSAITFPLTVNQGGTGWNYLNPKSLLIGNGSGNVSNLALGNNGYILMSDFNNAGNIYGMKWENPTIGYVNKGYILGGTGAGTAAPLAPGTNGQQLTADSTQSTGLRWGSPTVMADADFLALQAKVDDMLSRLEALER